MYRCCTDLAQTLYRCCTDVVQMSHDVTSSPAGPPRRCRGHNLVDAAIFEPVPLRTALRDGCTHVLVLCTRPATLHTTWRRAVRGTVVRVVKQTVLNAPYMQAAWSSESSEQLASQVGGLAALGLLGWGLLGWEG